MKYPNEFEKTKNLDSDVVIPTKKKRFEIEEEDTQYYTQCEKMKIYVPSALPLYFSQKIFRQINLQLILNKTIDFTEFSLKTLKPKFRTPLHIVEITEIHCALTSVEK